MKMERLNAWMSLAGNVAVLLGLVALAIEISAATDALRVQVSENTFVMQQERIGAVAENTDLRTMYVKSLLNPSELTPSEAWGITAHLSMRLESINRRFHLYKDGVITEASWESALGSAPYYFSGSVGQLFWSEIKEGYADEPDFVAAIDSSLAESKGKGLSDEEWLRSFHQKIANL